MNLAYSRQGLLLEVSNHQPTLDSVIQKDEDPIVASPQLVSHTERQLSNGIDSNSSPKAPDEEIKVGKS